MTVAPSLPTFQRLRTVSTSVSTHWLQLAEIIPSRDHRSYWALAARPKLVVLDEGS